MDDGGEEGDESRSSTASNTRRRTVAVTTQESLDGTREKAMRIASLGELEESSGAKKGISPGGAGIDKTKNAKDIVMALMG